MNCAMTIIRFRGSVPPGARFDPYGPPDIGPRGGPGRGLGEPDPDHLPPPGYDDMFM
jgi:proteasome inhibitor subunit 1 (PI31)